MSTLFFKLFEFQLCLLPFILSFYFANFFTAIGKKSAYKDTYLYFQNTVTNIFFLRKTIVNLSVFYYYSKGCVCIGVYG